ncbi:ATP-binding protein [Burkholderia ambifaria]|uniref:ATP-binding protein n=1 Tax=Burkholderia ambifaria TaxID=152480 RepID=UPI000F8087B0|nr:ATP-binding protein [Burkholderia ambifaria]
MADLTVASAPIDLDRLQRRFQSLQLRLASLQGQAAELNTQKTRLTRNIALAKARIELAPQAAEVFNYLQEKAHARAVGEFEDLLSAFLADVVPETGSIHLEVGTERGAPALDILLDNGGKLEDILDGNGGGLTNVVVTGLVYASLARTDNRPFVVLDEPDCWLKATRVPAFTRVIAEVANPRTLEDGAVAPGCQTLMISHNDISLMDAGAHIMALADEDGLPHVTSVSGARAWEDEVQVGVRWVEVENLRRHAKTRMELSPGLNVLTGDVNQGKSTLIITAFRAMAYGESDDSMIRHDTERAIVRMGLENRVVLEMMRNLKGAPKVLYRRYVDGTLVNEGRQETRGTVPDFITESLGIKRVDDLDIQLRSQKQPVFLLNEPPARRARLLSVGRESGLLQALIEKHRLELKRDRDQVKRDEIELNQVNRTLTALAPLAGMSSLTDILTGLLEDAKASDVKLSGLRAAVSRLATQEVRARLQARVTGQLDAAIVVPSLHDAKPLASLVSRIERTRDVARLPLPQDVPGLPVLTDTQPLASLVARVARTRDAAHLPLPPDSPALPALTDTNPLASLIARLACGAQVARLAATLPRAPAVPEVADTTLLRRAGATLVQRGTGIDTANKDAQQALAEQEQAERDMRDLKNQLGVCPVCDTPFGEHNHG